MKMVLRILFTASLLNFLVLYVIANNNYERLTLHGHADLPPVKSKSLILNAEDTGTETRQRREATVPKNNFTTVSLVFPIVLFGY